MALKRASEPAVEPVSLDEIKDHLNIEHAEKDVLLQTYISAARGLVEQSCHIVVAETDYVLTLDSFPASSIYLGVTPVIAVDSIQYDDEDGNEQTLDSVGYYLDNSQDYAWVVLSADTSWPSTLSAVNAVRVNFRAGYMTGTGSDGAPRPLCQAIKLLVGDWFEYRGATADKSVMEFPYAVEALISPYRQPVLK